MSRAAYPNGRDPRRSLPAELGDLASWPAVDEDALRDTSKETFRKRRAAIALYVESPDVSLSAIQSQTGISPSRIYTFLDRCLAEHQDGRIYGFRGLVPYTRMKQYERTSAPPTTGKGSAGAFRQLLRRFPAVKTWLDKAIRSRIKKTDGLEEVRPMAKHLHKKLKTTLRAEGVTDDQYPFCVERQGKRSLEAYIRHTLSTSFSLAAADAGRQNVSENPPDNMRFTPLAAVTPYELVEADAHRLDLQLALEIPDPLGHSQLVEIGRIWVIVILEVVTRSALGYSISMRTQYSCADVLAAIANAIYPAPRRTPSIPTLAIPEGSGFPRDIFPECSHAVWDQIRLDNHLSHSAGASIRALSRVVGASIEFGRPGTPNDREFIEPFFRTLSRNFAHRLPGTTGASPNDLRRALGDVGTDIRMRINVTELADLIEYVLAQGNSTPHTGLAGRTPIEAMARYLARPDCMIRRLSSYYQSRPHILGKLLLLPVRGSPKDGRRPHVNFKEVRYTNHILADNAKMIGKILRVYVVESDIRLLYSYLETGEELGPLIAARPWNLTPHSVSTRQAINKMVALGKLRYGPDDDPVSLFMQYKRARAKESKTEATTLSQVMKDAAEPLTPKEYNKVETEARSSLEEGDEEVAPTPLSITTTIRF